jgi:hypothetical protein
MMVVLTQMQIQGRENPDKISVRHNLRRKSAPFCFILRIERTTGSCRSQIQLMRRLVQGAHLSLQSTQPEASRLHPRTYTASTGRISSHSSSAPCFFASATSSSTSQLHETYLPRNASAARWPASQTQKPAASSGVSLANGRGRECRVRRGAQMSVRTRAGVAGPAVCSGARHPSRRRLRARRVNRRAG